MNIDIFTALDKKDFNSFSKAVKQTLDNKVRNNPRMKGYEDEFTRIQNIKSTFAKINSKYSKGE